MPPSSAIGRSGAGRMHVRQIRPTHQEGRGWLTVKAAKELGLSFLFFWLRALPSIGRNTNANESRNSFIEHDCLMYETSQKTMMTMSNIRVTAEIADFPLIRPQRQPSTADQPRSGMISSGVLPRLSLCSNLLGHTLEIPSYCISDSWATFRSSYIRHGHGYTYMYALSFLLAYLAREIRSCLRYTKPMKKR